jgi:RNA polymerase sigma-70 factor (ECF subfamily)
VPPPAPEQLSRTIETLYRSESGRVLATLVRLLGDLDLAEEAMHEAFAAASFAKSRATSVIAPLSLSI